MLIPREFWWLAFGLASLVMAAQAWASPRTLAFYPVRHVDTPPVIDGDLSDDAWARAPQGVDHYEYWKADPDFGQLRTRLQMLWSEQGIYVGVRNEDDNPSGIRAKVTTRDDSHLWMDDCNEIYFDPAAQSIGYTRFVVNALGTQQDDRRIDASVSLPEWSGVGWIVKTRITDKGWMLEAFFPWGDLGATAREGDIWRFNLVRYGYSTGKFIGVTWSPGGNYSSTDKFGYLYFTRQQPEVKTIGSLLEKSAVPPWQLLVGDGLLVRPAGDHAASFVKAEQYLADAYTRTGDRLQQAKQASAGNAPVQEALAKLAEQFQADSGPLEKPADALMRMKRLGVIQQRVDELYWQGRLESLLAAL